MKKSITGNHVLSEDHCRRRVAGKITPLASVKRPHCRVGVVSHSDHSLVSVPESASTCSQLMELWSLGNIQQFNLIPTI